MVLAKSLRCQRFVLRRIHLRFIQLLVLFKIDEEKVSGDVLVRKKFSITRCNQL